MQITITGPRGGGSTTLAAFIARKLRDRGFNVRVHSRSENASDHIDNLAKRRLDHAVNGQGRSVAIVDGVEPEDEQSFSPSLPITESPKQEPPLGAIPEAIHHEHRLAELLKAVERFRAAGKPPKTEWLEEIREITYRLDSLRQE